MVIIYSLKLQLCDNERTHYALVYLYIILLVNGSVTMHLVKFNNISVFVVNGLYVARNSVCGDISEAEVHL